MELKTQTALASAGALDAKAAARFDAESSDLAANIDALTRAIAALEKGVAGSSFPSERCGPCYTPGGHEFEQGFGGRSFHVVVFLIGW